MKWPILSLGLVLLFSGAFLDNLRGPLLPILANAFNLTHSDSSVFLIVGSLGGIAATFLLIPLTRFTTERLVLKGLLSFSLLVIGLSFFVTNYWGLLIFGTAIGISVSTLGAMANLVTIQASSADNRGKAFSLLHTMYGIGSFLAPNMVSLSLISSIGWRMPFLVLAVILVGAFLLTHLVLPKTLSKEILIPERTKLTRFQLFTVGLFSIYVAGEVMVSMWMVTYLVDAASLTVTEASTLLGRFFLVMMLTRAVLFISLKPKHEKPVLVLSLLLAILFLGIGLTGSLWAFPLIGLFGPFFPLLLSHVTRRFHTQGKSITLWIIGVNSIFIMVSHRFVGTLSDQIGLTQAYWSSWALLVIAFGLLVLFIRYEKRY